QELLLLAVRDDRPPRARGRMEQRANRRRIGPPPAPARAAEEALERRLRGRHRRELRERLLEQVRQAAEVDARARAHQREPLLQRAPRRGERRIVLRLDDRRDAAVQRAGAAALPAFLVREPRL